MQNKDIDSILKNSLFVANYRDKRFLVSVVNPTNPKTHSGRDQPNWREDICRKFNTETKGIHKDTSFEIVEPFTVFTINHRHADLVGFLRILSMFVENWNQAAKKPEQAAFPTMSVDNFNSFLRAKKEYDMDISLITKRK